jgi:ABC-2 type transport system permease protein
MNKNLFHMEFRKNLLSLLVWTVIITLLVSVTMAVFPMFMKNQSKITGMMSIIPKELLQFKGVSNLNDFMSTLGFYSVNNIIYMMVLGSIYSIVLASGIVHKEEYNKTAEYLLTRPLTRAEIFETKLAVAGLNIFILNLVTALAGLICIEIVKTEPLRFSAFLIITFYTLLLNILFGAIGLFLSVILKRSKPISTQCIGLVLVFYFIFTLAKITESISKIGYISPFRYVDTEAVNPAYGLDPWRLLYFTGISLLLTFAAFRLYLRKDIYT